MKRRFLTAACLSIAIFACNKNNSTVATVTPAAKSTPHAANRSFDSSSDFTTRFIPVDIANDMISSYLYSIDYTHNDTDVRSFSVDADSLRAYLSNPTVKKVKLMFAHTESYIGAGYRGVNAGYRTGALTIVIAGYDGSGNYIYNAGMVLDHAAPCPYTCPDGSASAALLE